MDVCQRTPIFNIPRMCFLHRQLHHPSCHMAPHTQLELHPQNSIRKLHKLHIGCCNEGTPYAIDFLADMLRAKAPSGLKTPWSNNRVKPCAGRLFGLYGSRNGIGKSKHVEACRIRP